MVASRAAHGAGGTYSAPTANNFPPSPALSALPARLSIIFFPQLIGHPEHQPFSNQRLSNRAVARRAPARGANILLAAVARAARARPLPAPPHDEPLEYFLYARPCKSDCPVCPEHYSRDLADGSLGDSEARACREFAVAHGMYFKVRGEAARAGWTE